MYKSTGNTDWCSHPSMDSGGPYMDGREQTVEPLGTLQQTNLPGDASAEYLLAELGLLSLNTLTQKGKTEGVNRPSRRCLWGLLLGGSTWRKSTVTVWIWGVVLPGTGTWSPEDQSLSWQWYLTTCVIERKNIMFNLRSKNKKKHNIKLSH